METVDTGIADVVLKPLKEFGDARGWLTEGWRMDEWDHSPTMSYLSMTHPGLARGPHEHRLQTDLFVFTGIGAFQLYLMDNRKDSPTFGQSFTKVLGGDFPASVTIPPGVIHAYRCVSEPFGIVVNLPDKLYAGVGKSQPVDEVRHEDDENSPFYNDFEYKLFQNA